MRPMAWWHDFLITGMHLVLAGGSSYFLLKSWQDYWIVSGWFSLILTATLMPAIFLRLFLRRPRLGRPRWQLHLSTCVVLMFTASIFLGANMVSSKEKRIHVTMETRGWPAVYYAKLEASDPREIDPEYPYDRVSIAINLLCALDLLAATALGCEWWPSKARNMVLRS